MAHIVKVGPVADGTALVTLVDGSTAEIADKVAAQLRLTEPNARPYLSRDMRP